MNELLYIHAAVLLFYHSVKHVEKVLIQLC